jgi:hypothetical protein
MKPIRIDDEEGDLMVRDSIVLAFFTRQAFVKVVPAFAKCLDCWLATVPSEAKRWALIGSNSETYSAVTEQRLAKAQREFTIGKVKRGDGRVLEMVQPRLFLLG